MLQRICIKRKQKGAANYPSEVKLLSKIRDLLKK